MRFLLIASGIVVFALIACNGPGQPTAGVGPQDTEPPPAGATVTTQSSGNTLIETPEYTGVLISKKGASEFDYVFNEPPPEYWQPSVSDVSKAEECMKKFLVSAPDDPTLDASRKYNAVFILDNLEKYRRQYVGIVVDGEKRIWCNAFYADDSYPDWMRLPVWPLDGGNYHWDIEYVVPRDECINFYVHGEG